MARLLFVLSLALGARVASVAEKNDLPCLAPPVTLVRAHARPTESARLSLTRCDGSSNLSALPELSVLARPHGESRETRAARRRGTVRAEDEGVLLDPRLLIRLQAIANRFPDRTIEIVSGHRPSARPTSRHFHGRALDLRVSGVSHEELSEFARTLPATGVGFYPRSVFTHIDVRERAAYWVDRSRPGEAPDYGPWPIPSEPGEIVATAMPAPEAPLPVETEDDDPTYDEAYLLALAPGAEEPPSEGEPELSAEDIRRIREEALAALERMLAADRR